MIRQKIRLRTLNNLLSVKLLILLLFISCTIQFQPVSAEDAINAGSDIKLSENKLKLAVITCTDTTIVPTAGSIEWYISDIPAIVQKEISKTYTSDKFLLIPQEAVSVELSKNGYDVNALELPEREDIIKIAAGLSADAVLAIELTSLGVVISKSSYQFYVISRYRAFLTRNNRFILRRFIYEGPVFSNQVNLKEQKDKLSETVKATIDSIFANCMFDKSWGT